MRKEMPKLDSPLNADERALYNIAVRLDRVIELIELFIDDKIEEVIEVNTPIVEEIEKVDYISMTKAQIKELLIDKNIEYNDKMTKTELIELIK